MQSPNASKTTREGPAFSGESLGAPAFSQRIGPIVSGGAKLCSVREGEGEIGRRGSASAAATVGQPRVLLERLDLRGQGGDQAPLVPMSVEGDGGASSDCSLVLAAPEKPGRLWRKRRQESEEELSGSSGGESPTGPRKRCSGRGRPPTTGKYVGLNQAKAQLLAASREELRLRAEEELAAEVAQLRKARRSPVVVPGPVVELSSKTAGELQNQIQNEVAVIGTIASKSRNLKSNFVRDLRVAVASITEATAEIMSRTKDDETERLRRQNVALKDELSSIRKELESLKAEVGRLRGVAHSPAEVADVPREGGKSPLLGRPPPKRRRVEPDSATSLEDVCRKVIGTVGSMMDARFAALEGRLLPETNLRPPLAGDRRAQAGLAPGPKPRATAPKAAPSVSAPKVPGVGPKSRKGKARVDAFIPAPPPPPLTEGWNTVTRRKGANQRQPTPQQQPQARQQQPGRQPPPSQPRTRQQPPRRQQPETWKQQGRPRKRKRERKLRTPRSAAVVITLQPEAETKGLEYGQVLAKAKAAINLAEIGISAGVRIKKTATGARLMEVVGANQSERADSLAAKLRECLGDEVVRVHRPVRTVEMRVSGLDDSVTVGEVSAAVARVGECPVEQVHMGVISVGVDGLGSVWLRLPVSAARKVVDGGRLLVGWVSAQAKLLEARTQRCFRCLQVGHMRASCKSEVDRSNECYRCGVAGHKARGCTALAHCNLCSAAGKPADHRSGGKACALPPKSKGGSAGGPRAGKQNPRPTVSRAERAEEMAVG